MIPKLIHYCWFGGKPLPAHVEKCIMSWKTTCPDYEIIRWDEENVSLEDSRYAREAYQSGKWAFVSDYVRLKVLWKYGGIYLDTDVEVLSDFSRFLDKSMFMGFENREKVATCVIGAEPQHPFLEEMLEEYQRISFLRVDGSCDCMTNVERITESLKKRGMLLNGSLQNIHNVTVYPCTVFSPKSIATGKIKLTPETCTIHHFDASWMTASQRRHTRIAQMIGPEWTMKIKNLLKVLRRTV